MIKDNKVIVDEKQFVNILERYILEEKKFFWKPLRKYKSFKEAREDMSKYVISQMKYEDFIDKDINLISEKVGNGKVVYTFEEIRKPEYRYFIAYEKISGPKNKFHKFRIKTKFEKGDN